MNRRDIPTIHALALHSRINPYSIHGRSWLHSISVMDDLAKIKTHPAPTSGRPVDVAALLAIHHALRVASREVPFQSHPRGTNKER